jgi:hypothetical protein
MWLSAGRHVPHPGIAAWQASPMPGGAHHKPGGALLMQSVHPDCGRVAGERYPVRAGFGLETSRNGKIAGISEEILGISNPCLILPSAMRHAGSVIAYQSQFVSATFVL